MYLAVGLGFLGVVVLAVAQLTEASGRRTWTAAATCATLAVSIWAMLAFAEPAVCQALGGESFRNGSEHACGNEFGGNGTNNSSEGITFFD